MGSSRMRLKPNARAGYLMNKIAGRPDVAVVAQASGPIVAEQMTYLGYNHDQATATFGTAPIATSWAFAAAGTRSAQREQDLLNLFNPNQAALPIVVRFMDTQGRVTDRTYVVGPLSSQRIDVGSVMPNAEVGIVVTSNQPFAALNRYIFNGSLAAGTSVGISDGGL